MGRNRNPAVTVIDTAHWRDRTRKSRLAAGAKAIRTRWAKVFTGCVAAIGWASEWGWLVLDWRSYDSP